jgi:hypothetical protein
MPLRCVFYRQTAVQSCPHRELMTVLCFVTLTQCTRSVSGDIHCAHVGPVVRDATTGGVRKRDSSRRLWPSGARIMAISTRWSASPVTRPAHSPSIVARPSSSRPSSRNKSIVSPRSSTTTPTLSIRLSATPRLYKMSHRCNNGRFATPKQNPRGVCQIAPEQPLIGGNYGQSGSDRRISTKLT